MFDSGWVAQYANTAFESSKQHTIANVDSTTLTAATAGPSTPVDRNPQSESASIVIKETSSVAPPVSKRAKLFSFMLPNNNIQSTNAATNVNLTVKDISQQFTLFVSDNGIAGQGLQVFNDKRFNGLRPLVRKLFTAPASSAASERVFSKAGLIMRPTRSRLSKANLSKLVFLGCNGNKL
jgi:hAT family C-terminal dimerisation region